MSVRPSALLALSLILALGACSSDNSAESECFAAVGQLHDSMDSYDVLLERGVSQMRDQDAVEELNGLVADYSELLDVLNARRDGLPADIEEAHDLFASGVGLQVSAWTAIRDGLRFNNTDLIEDAAAMIALSREVVGEARSAIPACAVG